VATPKKDGQTHTTNGTGTEAADPLNPNDYYTLHKEIKE